MITNRVYLEEFARDSFENLLFAICRFKEVTSHYPSKITVIGFDFKAHRFTSLHRHAIGFPSANFTYIGLKPPSYHFNYQSAMKGEEVAVKEFQKDMYGCKNRELVNKRKVRNPFARTIPYAMACSELKELLQWCGGTSSSVADSHSPSQLYDLKKLPWYNTNDH